MKLFSPDSPIGRAISLLADLVILNLLFLFSCMPVVTVGAACGALYDTVNAMLAGEHGILYRQYFSSFKKCFVKGTLLFLLSAAVISVIVIDLILASGVEGIMGLLCTGVISGSLIIVLGVMAHLPMTVCRNPREQVILCLRTGLSLAVRNTWRTLAAVVLNLAPFVLFLFAPGLFLRTWMFWFLIGFAALAYMNNWLLLRSVDPDLWMALRPVQQKDA